jgi:preprotein translocase subunit SecE
VGTGKESSSSFVLFREVSAELARVTFGSKKNKEANNQVM